jgi:hypothetical protein
MTPLVLTHAQLAVLESVARRDEYAGNLGPNRTLARELEAKGLLALRPVGELPVWGLTVLGSVTLQDVMARMRLDG